MKIIIPKTNKILIIYSVILSIFTIYLLSQKVIVYEVEKIETVYVEKVTPEIEEESMETKNKIIVFTIISLSVLLFLIIIIIVEKNI